MAETQESVIREICGRFGNDRTRLMDILLEAHRRLGSVSGEAVDAIAQAVKLPRVEVESTLSFYAFFSPKPRGKFVIRLCDDIIDQMHGADRVLAGVNAATPFDLGHQSRQKLRQRGLQLATPGRPLLFFRMANGRNSARFFDHNHVCIVIHDFYIVRRSRRGRRLWQQLENFAGAHAPSDVFAQIAVDHYATRRQ